MIPASWFTVALGWVIYYLPALIAFFRSLPTTKWVMLINIFTGWTVIGWFWALRLACSSY